MTQNSLPSLYRRNIAQQNKGHYDNPTANIILIDGKLIKDFPLKSGVRQGSPLLQLLLNKGLEDKQSDKTAISQENKTKDIQIGKEELNLLLVADNMR